MIFPETFCSAVLSHGRRFSLSNILSIPAAINGVYVLFHSRTFIYVGKSTDVRSRMLMHYDGTHNRLLRVWINALDGRIRFKYFCCTSLDVDDVEKSMIRFLQPFANAHRYSEYQPMPITWR